MPVTAKYILLCDDVRVENNGKLLVVGLYTGDMSVPQIFFILPTLTFLTCLDSGRPGNSPFRMKLQNLETGRPVVDGMGGIQFARPGTAYAPVRMGGIQHEPAEHVRSVWHIRRPVGTPWRENGALPLKLNENACKFCNAQFGTPHAIKNT
jgi:hypothetical protein